ncbi:MAG TPA: hypothetical protein VNS63_01825 [Blastocatellia bacterium]|nr:hypothetical protein [Blastocatellia bacterium]
MLLDEEHLKLLRIGYIVAGISDLFFAFVPLIYVVMGILVAAFSGGQRRSGEPNPALFGLIFVVIGLVVSGFFAGAAALKLLAARARPDAVANSLSRCGDALLYQPSVGDAAWRTLVLGLMPRKCDQAIRGTDASRCAAFGARSLVALFRTRRKPIACRGSAAMIHPARMGEELKSSRAIRA